MSMSRPAVQPVEAPPLTDEVVAVSPTRLRMKDVQGMPGTWLGLALRVCQFVFAAVFLSVMASTNDFPYVTAFRYLVAAVSLQSVWSLALAVVDIYALLVKLRNGSIVCAASKQTNSLPLTGVMFEPFEEVKKELSLVSSVS